MRSLVAFSIALLIGAAAAQAEVVHIDPPESCSGEEEFVRAANALKPGDELVLAPGTYCQTGRRLIQVSGTAERPIVIRGAGAGKTIVTRPGDPSKGFKFEGVEFDGAYLEIRDIHFRGGKRGLVFHAGAHHITVEGVEVSQTSNNGLTLNNGDTSHFIIRRNHIHHTGNLDPAIGNTEGEGMYVGCNDAKCIAHDHLIEGNIIHDLRGSSSGGNDGIEIKYGSYGNIVRGNTIHSIYPALKDTKYPCIFAYGVLDEHIDRPNIIENNNLSGCGEAIQVVSDAIVRNNTIMFSQQALATYYHGQVPIQRNLTITENIIVDSPFALRFGHQGKLHEQPNTDLKPPPRNIVFSGNSILFQRDKAEIAIDFPIGGHITILENKFAGDVSVDVRRDPDVSIGPNAFVKAKIGEWTISPLHNGKPKPQ